jgi:hypothetical protein
MPTTAREAANFRRQVATAPLWSWSPVLSQRPNRTQRITAKDLESGQTRIPSIGAASTKTLFPPDKQARIEVLLRGQITGSLVESADGPDRERSGILGLGAKLGKSCVREDDVLVVSLPKSRTPTLECVSFALTRNSFTPEAFLDRESRGLSMTSTKSIQITAVSRTLL